MKWKILYNMTKNTKHLKKQKTFQNIPQIPDIYRLCLHEMESSVQHDKKYKTFKKQKTFQNIPQIPDIQVMHPWNGKFCTTWQKIQNI